MDDELKDLPTIELEFIRPTPDEISEGYQTLQKCWPKWIDTPGLLVDSEDTLGLIVSTIEYSHDDLGFVLSLEVREKLVAPSDFDYEECRISFGWNQPYLSIGGDGISAPYAYYLHFGHEGVERAREFHRAMPDELREIMGPRVMRGFFDPHGTQHLADMMEAFKKHSQGG
jgi:hypothetical protein